MHTDRQIAVWGGWIAGPAFGVAMMAAPEYLHLKPDLAAWFFWGGNLVFVLTVFVVAALQSRDREQGRRSMWPIVIMAAGVTIFGVGAAWHFWPTAHGVEKLNTASAEQPSVKASSSLDGTLRLECVHEKFQFPADGKYWALVAGDNEARTLSFMHGWISQDSYRAHPDSIQTDAGMIDVCRLSNFGGAPVFNVTVNVQTFFSEIIPIDSMKATTQQVETKSYEFSIPQVDAGAANAFVFYAWNTTKYTLVIKLPKEVELQRLASAGREVVKLIPAFDILGLHPPRAR